MNDEPNSKKTESEEECGPNCDCGGSGASTKAKIIVCAVVGLAAAVVLARGFMKKAETENDGDQQVFVTDLPVNERAKETEEEGKKFVLWGGQLDSLAAVNEVAAGKDAVFVCLPTNDKKQIQAIRKEIEAAASKIMSRGTIVAAYMLDDDSPDYAQTISRVPAPCVLAMVKGGGITVVDDNITEESLVQAFVTASRSTCGPSGCGPSGCQ